jgi:hypothetical protein
MAVCVPERTVQRLLASVFGTDAPAPARSQGITISSTAVTLPFNVPSRLAADGTATGLYL